MIYKFKSKAAGDVIMLEAPGDQVLRAAGREPAAQGIFEAAALPAAIAALEQAIAAEGGVEKATGNDAPEEEAARGPAVNLRQRAWPLLEMLKRAQAAGESVVWGV